MSRERHEARQAGFTLLEIMIVVAVSLPILGSVIVTSTMVGSEIKSSEASASAADTCRRVGQRMALLSRAGALSTCRVRATQEDVDAAILANAIDPSVVIPALGDWIAPPDGVDRPSFRFQAAKGELAMNASALTPVREFEFVLEPGETDNEVDDDGDGMVDEGSLTLREGTTVLQVATGLERCLFRLSGRIMTFELRSARRDNAGRVYRSTTRQEIYFRNS